MNKKLLRLFPLVMLVLPLMNSCGGEQRIQLKNEICEYVFETEVYKTIDQDFCDKYFLETYDNWSGGCSAISKVIDGNLYIGRNMDLNISNKCAYIVRTELEGKNKTMGLAYTFRDISPDYNEAKTQGIKESFSKLLPYFCDDVMNEHGLHIEINMRNAEYWPNGDDMFACKGTNPESNEKVYMFELPQLIAANCKTVEDAKKYVQKLNIFSKEHYWNYCFLVSDATGQSELLELALDTVFWLKKDDLKLTMPNTKEVAQTNFYLNPVCFILQNTKSGLGRYDTLQEGIDSVKDKQELFNLMDKIAYSHFYSTYDDCKDNHFDPRSENIGTFKAASYEIIMNPELEVYIRDMYNEYTEPIRNMTREEKAIKNEYWESSFTEVVDIANKTINVRFFENNNKLYKITFDSITKIENLNY